MFKNYFTAKTHLYKLDPHLSGRDFGLVALVEDLPVLDFELDVLVEGDAAADPLEDVQVGRDGQVTVEDDVEHLKRSEERVGRVSGEAVNPYNPFVGRLATR